MNVKKLAVSAVVSASMLGTALTPALAANLVENGSFEEPVYSGWFDTYAAPSSELTGWSLISGTIDHINALWEASDGDQSLDMTGYTAGTITQEIETTPGAVYTLSFDMSGNPDGPNEVKPLQVSAGDDSQLFEYEVTVDNARDNMLWEPKLMQFTAEGETTLLTFASMLAGYYGAALDNVSVEQYLPETKDDCKKDGWEAFGVFKNQGDCVSYVATGGTNLPAVQ